VLRPSQCERIGATVLLVPTVTSQPGAARLSAVFAERWFADTPIAPEMLGADVPLPGVTRLFAGQDKDFTRAICEPLQHISRIAARNARRKSG
jgi:hypothetical protein